MILNIEFNDYDITTNANLDEIKNIFKDYNPKLYSSKKCIRIKMGDIHIELSPFKGKNIEEDLINRDYKINSLLINIDGELIDYLGGLNNINDKKLELVNLPNHVFNEDPYRILRGIRLHAKYNLTPSSELINNMNKYAYLLKNIHPSRIRYELDQILTIAKPSTYLLLYKEVFINIFNELSKCVGFDQKSNYHIYDVYQHIALVVDYVEPKIEIRLAALLHDIKKPDAFYLDKNGLGHFPLHDVLSANYAKEILSYYSYSKRIINIVYKLILYHDIRLKMDREYILNFLTLLSSYDIDYFFMLQEADMKAQNPKLISRLTNYNEIKKYVKNIINEKNYINVSDLKISVSDFNKLGYNDLELIEDTIRKMTIDVINSKLINDRIILLNRIDEYINN